VTGRQARAEHEPEHAVTRSSATALRARVEEAGAQRLSPPADRSWGERAAWFADSDRNLIAVAQAAAVVA
jgi:hypothetical protein